MHVIELSDSFPPTRLDKIVSQHLQCGLRSSRQMIEQGLVMVDGYPLRKGDLIRAGQSVTVRGQTNAMGDDLPSSGVFVVHKNDCLAAIFKPSNVHSVAGKGEPCLEVRLDALGLSGWELVNRLDYLTSGLVLAARSEEDARAYAQHQNLGLIRKYYLAEAQGELRSAATLRGRIVDDRRRIVRVMDDADEILRVTVITPLSVQNGRTLVMACILKGRRHQIRAHLAHAGHPLVGDPIYGCNVDGDFRLHHWRVEMPGFAAAIVPAWSGIILCSEQLLAAQVCLDESLRAAGIRPSDVPQSLPPMQGTPATKET